MILVVILDLAIAAHATWPQHLTPDRAQEHASHAEAAADPDRKVSPDLLLAVARVESGFHGDRVSRLVRGKRITGRWRSIRRPPSEGSLFCGVGQTRAGRSWRRCVLMRDLTVGYSALTDELAWWLEYTHGDLPAALRGHACGIRAKRTCGSHGGTRKPYADRVLDGLRRLRARRLAAQREAGT